MSGLKNGDPVSQTKDSSTLEEHAEHGRRLIAVMRDNMSETRNILASARRAHAEAIRMAKEEEKELGRRLHASLQREAILLDFFDRTTAVFRKNNRDSMKEVSYLCMFFFHDQSFHFSRLSSLKSVKL
jgi:hypothetical protein